MSFDIYISPGNFTTNKSSQHYNIDRSNIISEIAHLCSNIGISMSGTWHPDEIP